MCSLIFVCEHARFVIHAYSLISPCYDSVGGVRKCQRMARLPCFGTVKQRRVVNGLKKTPASNEAQVILAKRKSSGFGTRGEEKNKQTVARKALGFRGAAPRGAVRCGAVRCDTV